jgi:phosphate:Na+ symporter
VIETILFHSIGGLGLFMLGMHSMSDALQKIAGDKLRQAVNALTANRLFAVAVGIFVTCTIQSSSVTTVMVVGFVKAGLMQLTQAIGVIFGSNIGTTITGWIIAIKITKYALPILGCGVGFALFSKKESWKYFGELAMGFGLIFFGLHVMKTGFVELKSDPAFIAWFSRFGADSFGAIIMSIAVGAVLTMIIQSSSATLGITIALAISGVINFEGAAALILGENIGTTITAYLASINGTVASKRAAWAHIVFNVMGVVIIALIFKPYIVFVHYVVYDILGWAAVSANTLNSAGEAPQMAQYIAMSHTMFNVCNTILWLPFLGVLAKIVTMIVPDKDEKEITSLKFIDPEFMGIPSLALEKARIEILSLGEEVENMLNLTAALLAGKGDIKKSVNQALVHEEHIDRIQKDITVYLVELSTRGLNHEQSKESQSMIRAIDELESIGDYCERLVSTSRRINYDDLRFSEEANQTIVKAMNKVIKFYDLAHTGYINKNRTFLPEVVVKKNNIRDFTRFAREQHMARLNSGVCDSIAGLAFVNMVGEFEHMTSHIVNLAEAYVGEK